MADTQDGIHVVSRRTTERKCKDILSIIELGTNIGSTSIAFPYFMHAFVDTYYIDAGICYDKGWYTFANGEIINIDPKTGKNLKWKSESFTGINFGDTIQIGTRVMDGSDNRLLVYVNNSRGSRIKTMYVELSSTVANFLRNTGSRVDREMNIAGHDNIDNQNAFFSWSTFKESSITNTSNKTVKLTTSNSTLKEPYYDKPSYSHTHVGCGVATPTMVNGYVVDKAWCRCNNN